MNAMTTKGFGRTNKLKRVASGVSRAASQSGDAKLSHAGEGSHERTDPMNMMTKINPPTDERAIWDGAIAIWQQAKAAHETFEREVAQPVYEELDRRAPRPSLSYDVEAKNGETVTFSFLPAELEEAADSFVHGRRVKPMLESWRTYESRLDAASRDLGWNEIEAKSDRIADEMFESEDALMAIPAPDVEALATKILIAFHDRRFRDDWVEQLKADARTFTNISLD